MRIQDNRLRPLWMERLYRSGFFDDIRSYGLGSLTWAKLSREADEVRRRIEAGAPWPPPEASRLVLSIPNVTPNTFDLESFAGFVCLPTILRGILAMEQRMLHMGAPVHLAESLMATTAHELYHIVRFEHYGRKIYALDKTTYDLLLETDLPDMPLSLLRPPVPEFYLVLPKDNGLTVEAAGDIQPVEGVMVSFPDVEEAVYGLPARELNVLVTGISPKGDADDNLTFLSGTLQADMPIREVRITGAAGSTDFDRILHVILGTALYLASEHPALEPVPPLKVDLSAIKNPSKRAKAERRLNQYTRFGYVRIRSAPTAAPSSSHTPTRGRKLDHTVWVRGHWRHQPYGEGRTLRKWIWIRPHRRGPDMAEALSMKIAKIQTARPTKSDGS